MSSNIYKEIIVDDLKVIYNPINKSIFRIKSTKSSRTKGIYMPEENFKEFSKRFKKALKEKNNES